MSGFAEEPRTTYSARMGKAEFFAWLQMREGGRYELKDGEIVVHAGSSRRHAQLSARILVALVNRLEDRLWTAFASDFAIEVGDTIRYPDDVVDHAGGLDSSYSTNNPVLAVEVLSPSSVNRDTVEKLAEYTSLTALDTYIVASQDEPILWVWQRDRETRTFPALPSEIVGLDGSIDALGVTLPLAEIYRGIGDT